MVRLRSDSLSNFAGLPSAYWYVWAGTLINRLGGFVVPFLALYLTDTQRLSVAEAGLAVSLYGVGTVAAGPTGGVLADWIGRRRTLVLSLSLGGVSILLLGIARRAHVIFLAAALTGFLYELYRPAVSAMVADMVGPEDRPRAYGLLYWAINLGASIALVIAGFVASLSYLVLFVADAITTFAYAIIIWLLVPETRPAVQAVAASDGRFSDVFKDGVFVAFLVLTFVFAVVYFQSSAALPLDMRAHGVSLRQFGVIMAVNGALIVLLQPLAAKWAGRFESAHVLAVAALLLGTGFGANGWIGSAPLYAIAVGVWTLGEILWAPVTSAVVADLAPPALRGRYQGAFGLAFGLAVFAGPALGSLILNKFGGKPLWVGCAMVSVAAAAGHLAIGPARRRRSTGPAAA